MNRAFYAMIAAALILGAAALLPDAAPAASCCGGGSGSASILPRAFWSRADLTLEAEAYDGYWDHEGKVVEDPAGSSLNQYRLTLGYARRIDRRWQASVSVPWVWNDNTYSGLTSRTSGLGDSTLGLWWGTPGGGLHLGPALTVPTGVSPYDDVDSSFDVTGRGFYRLDGNLLLSDSRNDWEASLLLSYGVHFARPVNREYGRYVDPYRKKLGDRFSASASLGRGFPLATLAVANPSLSLSYLTEARTTIEGHEVSSSGMEKTSLAAGLTLTSWDRLTSLKFSFAHALRYNGAGRSFPITDTYTLGVSRGFR